MTNPQIHFDWRGLLQMILEGKPVDVARKIADPDIYLSLRELGEAIRARYNLEHAQQVSREKKVRQEERICIFTRALVAKYDSAIIWSRKKNEDLRAIIEFYLRCALEVMKVDADCKESVSDRLNEIENAERLNMFV